ncbi:MAG: hypothetical protein KGL39_60060, partial [Patescibacteria group bacterium]|nr:hypothetical protein [Patescibacteria group bacterium]
WTNYVGTNSLTFTNTVTNYDALPIQLSTLTAAPATGTVSIVTIDHPELIGHLNTFYGQSFDFTGASLSGLPTTTGLTTNIQVTDGNLASPSTNTLYFTNGILKAVTSP